MTRNLKALGLALVAIFAMSAIASSAAQATPGIFTWTAGTTKLTAEQDAVGGLQKFTTSNGNVECNEVHGEATVAGTESAEVTAQNIKYQNSGSAECNGPFGTHPKIEFNSCDYLFTAGETIGTTGMETTGQAHIKCATAGQQIVINASVCTIKVAEQTPTGGHVIFKTITGTKNHVTIEATVTGITYTASGLCTGGNNGTYTGNVTVKGYKQTPHEAAQQTSIEVH